jgi:hypothetical protein
MRGKGTQEESPCEEAAIIGAARHDPISARQSGFSAIGFSASALSAFREG